MKYGHIIWIRTLIYNFLLQELDLSGHQLRLHLSKSEIPIDLHVKQKVRSYLFQSFEWGVGKNYCDVTNIPHGLVSLKVQDFWGIENVLHPSY